MSPLLLLAARSAWNRRLTLGMTLIAVTLSVTLLLGVERVRHEARNSFAQSVAGTDLVVGARTSPVQLMLYAVFRLGEATNNIRWQSYRAIAENPAVAWSIPLSLGDSHHGFPVIGTSSAYFEHFRYGDAQALAFSAGKPFAGIFEAVLGAEVAARLGYRPGDQLILSHGMGDVSLAEHTDKPFTVVGILAATGTPVDRSVHVSLEAIQAIHLDWQGGAPLPGLSIPAEYVRKFDLTPKEITAVLLGLKNRAAVFKVQRDLNTRSAEPLLAVLPGVALDQLWQVVGIAERTLLAVSAMVVAVGLAGLVAVVLAGLGERRRELAILRSVGARPSEIFVLLTAEGLFVTVLGALLGAALLALLTALLGPLAQAHYGLAIRARWISSDELALLGAVVAVGLLASLLPGYRAYRISLADGLTPRL
ncbi:MAG: ABC transporter permease [Candidatus Accumulibacter phosphatis]|uniref:ABC transporter permease n=2 Tax=Candidatus Accumulibacter TaxID=327159 RepID=A0A7D5NHM7_9PROT|nr:MULTISPECIES: ABC transporter permease [Candidatus Accumulibacter]QLH52189.1 MAG: ABC transporter permease [Candidatus Accumulibacter cognatus]MBL8401926.1 ABC transporter permease [Accumulibacter sp.]MBN8518661.1 ABC transporter permease [Accumulibacter sp.]MBO3713169.1 ABC transporter permease [Accumulibacter sp.]MCQ1551316.1 ABC transporter permease [Candidatus Accumulibacter phosphatis]